LLLSFPHSKNGIRDVTTNPLTDSY